MESVTLHQREGRHHGVTLARRQEAYGDGAQHHRSCRCTALTPGSPGSPACRALPLREVKTLSTQASWADI